MGESIFQQLLTMAENSPNLFHHQMVHNELLRQLVDSAQISNKRFKTHAVQPWMQEVDFD